MLSFLYYPFPTYPSSLNTVKINGRENHPETMATSGTQDRERKQTKAKKHNITQKTKNTDTTKKLAKGKQFLLLIRHLPCLEFLFTFSSTNMYMVFRFS